MNGELSGIDSAAFENTNLKSITIPDSIKYFSGISENEVNGAMFFNCKLLKEIIISENSSLTRIGYAFAQHAPVKKFFIPKNCMISPGSFSLMDNLSVTIDPRNPYMKMYDTCIYSFNFDSLYWLPVYYPNQFSFHSYCDTIETQAFRGYKTNNDLVIPKGISTIKVGAFFECNCRSIIFQNETTETPNYYLFLGSHAVIKMPEKLRVVRSMFFQRFDGSYIEFLSDLQMIESESFINCTYLEMIKFNKLKNNMIIDSNSFYNCESLKLLPFPFDSSDIITFNSTCLNRCKSFKGIKFYIIVPRKIMNFNVDKKLIEIDVKTSNSNGIIIDCGKFHVKDPFDDKCHIPIYSCNRFHSTLGFYYFYVFIAIAIE
ncbi:hypothetical protein TVAG_354050 [Trichomonas vaginalis G3]|uniref:Surface antigen BspA-like n=1 Tax=Trichomonas vaginalis (strain ATCC PRA-98 / G3) TaxID=412133 RepID=A2FH25_TRIV3|nr:BspA type Leucine rich repeat region (6 copies) family [Trichomonas vaginalis G3]EAX95793.1 hypothetical protein TVAG_354050 [Trichomonas vaginalis G3]KAI5536537.1 BspA type Leucine rich repeat region (6 copies) family [Trichomonas vaginalis G3]|eukprot:XP_001308723.1 hypothetical protein [Trichomonas vaginalis G3]